MCCCAEIPACLQVPRNNDIYIFARNMPFLHTSIVHFQLRNLLWATTAHDIYCVHNNSVVHWNVLTRESRIVLNLTGAERGSQNYGQVYVSTVCAAHGLVAAGMSCPRLPNLCAAPLATLIRQGSLYRDCLNQSVRNRCDPAGGFNGEVIVVNERGEAKWNHRVSREENCITNSLEIAEAHTGAVSLLASNNDEKVRLLDPEAQQTVCQFDLPWASNCASINQTNRCDHAASLR